MKTTSLGSPNSQPAASTASGSLLPSSRDANRGGNSVTIVSDSENDLRRQAGLLNLDGWRAMSREPAREGRLLFLHMEKQ